MTTDIVIEAFIFTNGSNTFDQCLLSVQNQTLPIKYTVIRDKTLIQAMEICLSKCENKFFIKIDDDMFLHPRAFEYINDRLEGKNKSIALYTCKLWEPWRKKLVRCVKAYNKEIAADIGFGADKRGKIDMLFLEKLRSAQHKTVLDNSVIAIHALRDHQSQVRYRDLWVARAGCGIAKLRQMDSDQMEIHSRNITPESQYKSISKIYQYNAGTKFESYCNPEPTAVDNSEKRFFNFLVVQCGIGNTLMLSTDVKFYDKLNCRRTVFLTYSKDSYRQCKKIALKRNRGVHDSVLITDPITVNCDNIKNVYSVPELVILDVENEDYLLSVLHYFSEHGTNRFAINIESSKRYVICSELLENYKRWYCVLKKSKWLFASKGEMDWSHYKNCILECD